MSASILVGLKAARDSGGSTISIADVISQLPEIGSMKTGAQVVILARSTPPTGIFARVFGRKQHVPRGVRGSALLARGFVNIAAAGEGDDDLVWGYAPPLS